VKTSELPQDSVADLERETERVRDAASGSVGYKWDEASTYCASLTLAGSGWRLPTKSELLSILEVQYTPTINPAAFPNTRAARFWSSSPDAAAAGNVWYVSFADGISGSQSPSYTAIVRCVR
jgi:hypothetical protein